MKRDEAIAGAGGPPRTGGVPARTVLSAAFCVLCVLAVRAAVYGRTSCSGWPPDGRRLEREAARLSPGPDPDPAAKLVADWRLEIEELSAPLAELRSALAAEPDGTVRYRVAADALKRLDSGRMESELAGLARLKPGALRTAAAVYGAPVAAGSRASPEALGGALVGLAAARRAVRDRLSGPHPLAGDAFSAELGRWLSSD